MMLEYEQALLDVAIEQLNKKLGAIDTTLSRYTIEMRQRDSEIDKMIPHEPRVCLCIGACDPSNATYAGACVAVPYYHSAADMQSLLPHCRSMAQIFEKGE